jgi:hypothetical protein
LTRSAHCGDQIGNVVVKLLGIVNVAAPPCAAVCSSFVDNTRNLNDFAAFPLR